MLYSFHHERRLKKQTNLTEVLVSILKLVGKTNSFLVFFSAQLKKNTLSSPEFVYGGG